jgi:4'-phosphopantetheinyl transferase
MQTITSPLNAVANEALLILKLISLGSTPGGSGSLVSRRLICARRGTLRLTIDAMQELHLWQARLDSGGCPAADGLPAAERRRAAELRRPDARRRWTAAHWALREVLGRYLERDPTAIELRIGERGKPMLAAPNQPLHFNLSHSGELALIAISEECEVGVDVQRVGKRPAEFYAAWTRREATVKCHGTGLWAPLPETAVPLSVAELDAGPDYAAAVAIAAAEIPPLRELEVGPRVSAQ